VEGAAPRRRPATQPRFGGHVRVPEGRPCQWDKCLPHGRSRRSSAPFRWTAVRRQRLPLAAVGLGWPSTGTSVYWTDPANLVVNSRAVRRPLVDAGAPRVKVAGRAEREQPDGIAVDGDEQLVLVRADAASLASGMILRAGVDGRCARRRLRRPIPARDDGVDATRPSTGSTSIRALRIWAPS